MGLVVPVSLVRSSSNVQIFDGPFEDLQGCQWLVEGDFVPTVKSG